MTSEVDFISQDVATSTNTVVYSQTLSYTAAANEAATLNDLVLAPWKDTAYNQELAATLRENIPAFANLPASAIATPGIVPGGGGGPTPTPPITDGDTDDGGLSTGAIIGIAVGGAAALGLAGWGAKSYFGGDGKGGADGGGQYLGDDSAYNPPFAVSTGGDDEISRMDDPTVAIKSQEFEGGNPYGDQRCVCVCVCVCNDKKSQGDLCVAG